MTTFPKSHVFAARQRDWGPLLPPVLPLRDLLLTAFGQDVIQLGDPFLHRHLGFRRHRRRGLLRAGTANAAAAGRVTRNGPKKGLGKVEKRAVGRPAVQTRASRQRLLLLLLEEEFLICWLHDRRLCEERRRRGTE